MGSLNTLLDIVDSRLVVVNTLIELSKNMALSLAYSNHYGELLDAIHGAREDMMNLSDLSHC